MSLLYDLLLVAKNAKYFQYLGVGNDNDANEEFFPEKETAAFEEATPARIIKETIENAFKKVGGVSYDPIITCSTLENPPENNDMWFFINGITVDRDFVKMNGMALSKLMGGTKINVLHNPTQGLIKDLCEATIERSFNQRQDISHQLCGVILAAIRAGYNVKIIAHSQGAILLSSILRTIQERYDEEELLKGVEVYTFAAAFDSLKPINGVFYEHFANEHDIVARIGSIAFANEIPGRVYVRRKAKGHLFNNHYVGAMKQGLYCDKRSEFYKRYVAK
jgi:hypothetical protein